MCGIVGYTGKEQATPILLRGLARLEYRGYDSAGIAVSQDGAIQVCKTKGRLSNLEERLQQHPITGTAGIGHTRWATHGEPSDINAHPHINGDGSIAVIHNGIIENYLELKEWLQTQGCVFVSQTDTEVVAHLLGHYYKGDMLEALQRVTPMLEGSFALGVICRDEPQTIYATRKDSPLVMGVCSHGSVLASDIPALLEYTRDVYLLEDYDIAVAKPDGITFYTQFGMEEKKTPLHVDWNVEAAEKGGYAHFMLKEIHEEPAALKNTLTPLMDESGAQKVLRQDMMPFAEADVQAIERIMICACGTAYHAGLVGRLAIEKMAKIPVECDIASEFRYRDPILQKGTLFVVISQSGETADTIAAMREAKERGIKTLAITNVVGSTVAREADHVIYTWAGPEIAVASTKAFVSQLMVLYVLAADLAQKRGLLDAAGLDAYLTELKDLTPKAQELVDQAETYAKAAHRFSANHNAFYIGRNLDYTLSMEAALKLKEVSYVQAEAYAAGELKHGTIALIEPGTLVVALATQTALVDKTINNIKEVKVRGAHVLAIGAHGDLRIAREADEVWEMPACSDLFAPALATIPTQLFAYYMALERGCDIDKPRNLAKSVTVE